MEAKRQDIGMDIDENKKDTQNKTNTQDKTDTSNKKDKPDGSEKEEAQKSTSASREILSWTYVCTGDRSRISDQELSDHQRRCADRLHGKYDHAGGPPDRKSSRIFKGYTGARGCCDFPLSG